MAKKDIRSINLLPEFLRTNKNSKFLSSTLDQLIQPPKLERIDGFIGSKLTPTYNAVSDIYIKESLPLRQNYQLEPALVVKNNEQAILDVIGLDDITNQLTNTGAPTSNFNKVYDANYYSYDPHIDWDKFINYQKYYWLVTGPQTIDVEVSGVFNVEQEVIGKVNYVTNNGISLSNGMKIRFIGEVIPESYKGKEFFVEGVGTFINLVDYNLLQTPEGIANTYNDNFDATPFDKYPFDTFKDLPLDPEYITINRASKDLNPWSRYNRWVHEDIIRLSAHANKREPVYPANMRARRPIIEFSAGLKLYNFGSIGAQNVDLLDTVTTDAFSFVEGSAGHYIDGVLVEQGHRVIFNADNDSMVRGKIYEVNYVRLDGKLRIELRPTSDHIPPKEAAISVNLGKTQDSKCWWFNGDKWLISQQHTYLNQAPLFDLFDNNGNSYADIAYYASNFTGNKIFGYKEGTGIVDTVLGFSVKQENSAGIGSYVFENYFMTGSISVFKDNQVINVVPTGLTYCKIAGDTDQFLNVWVTSSDISIPIIQFQTTTSSTDTVEIIAINSPASAEFVLDVTVDNFRASTDSYSIVNRGSRSYVKFNDPLTESTNVLLKIYSDVPANENGYYQPPLGLTNNPLNGPISLVTFTEISEHIRTAIYKIPKFLGEFPGNSNLRDLADYSKYASILISNETPLAFSQFFIGRQENNLIDVLTKSADRYNQFKLAFLKKIAEIDNQTDPVVAVDTVLTDLNVDKDIRSPYYLSDMVAYGDNKSVRTWTVKNTANKIYPISQDFNLTSLSLRSVLVYLNGNQLLHGSEYKFVENDSAVEILVDLSVGDKIVVNDYPDTKGSYVPLTPSKLGLYPKYQPLMFYDDTYANGPIKVIQGHDGSITVAYNDYRDDIILELEKRIFNNIKVEYNSTLLDINSIVPGAFRNNEYTIDEVNQVIQGDFIRWAGFYGIDFTVNDTFDEQNPFTWNYLNTYNQILDKTLSGSWRNIYKYLFDTDSPHARPWEMLGLANKPAWWDSEYGPAPYTAGNDILWNDIELGMVRYGENAGTNPLYVRLGLSQMLPVDQRGKLVDPSILIAQSSTPYNRRQGWVIGNQSPAETAWRRSSYWPFVVQKLLALSKTVKYSSLMYDTSRLQKNISNQWTYGPQYSFLNFSNLVVYSDNNTLTSGYSALLVEINQQRSSTYVQDLKEELANIDVNLFYKVGGFVSKEKIQVIIDSVDPTSTGAGAILPQEDYQLILNVGNPVKYVSISGVIIQKVEGKFVIKGYDKFNPYFTIYNSIRNTNTPTITVGGKSQSYVLWAPSTSGGATGLATYEVASASAAPSGSFYQEGQIVKYGNDFYRAKVSHRSEAEFNSALFQRIPSLPIVGGATVQIAASFDSTEIKVPYGTEFSTIQEVYDLIMGYGEWLKSQGFIFNQYNIDLQSTLDWSFTAKEFLYWTTQNWAENSIITLSTFADQIQFKSTNSVVDNIFNSFYEYSVLQANGSPFPPGSLLVSRDEGLCTIKVVNSTEGIYFATIISVQKEHAMVFNNTTRFGDTIYDIETGYRQQRMKLVGFRTSEWDGNYFSPGFIYDTAKVDNWTAFASYKHSDVVKFNGKYYSAKSNIFGTSKFNFDQWVLLGEQPKPDLIPNFDYKITQFEDFYSLDIDNFDASQQAMAQHLIGYTPRKYLSNIFTNPIAQYKFYQGFIKEKGTRNAVKRLSKASIKSAQGDLDFTEEWAFRIGNYGSYLSYSEIEMPLPEGSFFENPQVVSVVDDIIISSNNLSYQVTPDNLTIKPNQYESTMTFALVDSEYNFKLPNAGYVRLDDVAATAYNENSLLSITNNRAINDGDYIWLGYTKSNDWDVYRYTLSPARITEISLVPADKEVGFKTDAMHRLSVGQVVSISQIDPSIDGVYIVKSISDLNQFTVTLSSSYLNQVPQDLSGLLFKFESARFKSYDSIPNDSALLNLCTGSKVWIDDDGTGNWVVYEKINNYGDYRFISSTEPTNQKLGWSISNISDEGYFLVSAPYYSVSDTNKGLVYLCKENPSYTVVEFRTSINDDQQYYDSTLDTEFGYSVKYDNFEFNNTGFGLIFAGAPSASYTKSNDVIATGSFRGAPILSLRYAYSSGAASSRVSEGLVKISSIDPGTMDSRSQRVLLSPRPKNYERFGHSIYVQENTSTKRLLVGAPGTNTIGTGTVYSYIVTATTGAVQISTPTIVNTSTITPSDIGSQWGYSISGTPNGNTIAISAPGYKSNTGFVYITLNAARLYYRHQTIYSPYGEQGKFGYKVKVSKNGEYLIVSAPEARNKDQSFGKVAIYYRKNITYPYSKVQDLENPVPYTGMKFGQDIDISDDLSTLVISAVGKNKDISVVFDKGDDVCEGLTTFDSKSTRFIDTVLHSGTAYIYNKKTSTGLFRLAQELGPVFETPNTNYGTSVAFGNNSIYVGSPGYKDLSESSALFQFYKKDITKADWNVLRQQDSLVDVDAIDRVCLVDTFKEEVIEYLDVIDPLKGKIPGLAEQDIKYRSVYDPAIYSTGTTGAVVDPLINWVEDHVGEIWWDISTVKYMWYEQGDLVYRKNAWGKLFPGSTVDIYEWVESKYLPSEWAVLADTTQGLALGISGQPKYADNSILSIKQTYDTVTNTFVNRYYYWVKNKALVPNTKNRRTSANEISLIITDPTAHGLKFLSVLDSNAFSLSNVGSMLVGDRISVNIRQDYNYEKAIPRHTEWLLLQEGVSTSVPNALLEKKLIDSLLGHDSLGNLVPDQSLTDRNRYGLGIRPQQTLFKNRLEAIRNIVDFSNQVLLENRITGFYSFVNLNKQEEIPSIETNRYDTVVEDNEGLSFIDTTRLVQGELACEVSNGKISAITITNPGFGYRRPPTVTVASDAGTGGELNTEIDSYGRIVSVTIENSGNGYVSAPTLTVRPFTAYILTDSTFDGKWSECIYSNVAKSWFRLRTQKYNTPLYWEYVDWKSNNYNKFIQYAYTVNEVSDLASLPNLQSGQYVKVKNGGFGYYIILEKIDESLEAGSFSNQFNIVYSQNGTIQISNNIWDIANSGFGFDQIKSYDQTLYDQTPDLELEYILSALKNDIFINELSVNWNLLFFSAIRYALVEQKLLDWAFKTSFINVVNNAGTLDQRPVYRLQSGDNFENYVEEVKPYRTNIRSFTTNYTSIENSQSYTTDFDLPVTYDKTSKIYSPIEINSNVPRSQFTVTNTLTNVYLWKSWTDNYDFEIGEIVIDDPGAGYTVPPVVDIKPAADDLGNIVPASAKAYISGDKVSAIELVYAGSGYTKTPIVTIRGGGDTKLTPARAYARLYNGKVRSNSIGIKFDRISKNIEINNDQVTDRFICNGEDTEFVLSWASNHNKDEFLVTLDGSIVLSYDYTIKQYTEEYNGYDKRYCKLIFLNYIPTLNQTLIVSYRKSIDLMNAVDRINYYYTATSGMPGNEPSQLMSGIEYPRTQLQGLMFEYSSQWDYSGYNFGESAWGDSVGYYFKTKVDQNANAGTDTLVVSNISGIKVGQYVNVINTLTNVFNTSTVYVKQINEQSRLIKLNSTLTQSVSSSTTVDNIEFWSYDDATSLLDSVVDGGSWEELDKIGALGIKPEDINISGDMFITPNTHYAPEELVPGGVSESLGINVYTKGPEGAPIVVSSSIDIERGKTTVRSLSIVPPNVNCITVSFNGTILVYNSTTTFTSSTQFSINWETNDIIVPPQPVSGKLGYTVISIGGGRPNTEAGVIDSASVTCENESSAQVQSLASYDTVKSAYVTVNGYAVPLVTTSSSYGYMLSTVDAGNRRAAATVYNLPPGMNTVTAWFFGTVNRYFNEVREEIFVINSTTDLTFTLAYPPTSIEPNVAQATVEFRESANSGREQLVPPHIDYYQVTDPLILSYQINNEGSFSNLDVRVYVNGRELARGFEYSVSSSSVNISSGILATGDVIAIVDRPTNSYQDYQYDIIGDTLFLVPKTDVNAPLGFITTSSGEIRVVTFADNDDMMMRIETFKGTPIRRYRISRPVLDESFVWVSVNGIPLVGRVDFEVLDDQVTIQVSDAFEHTEKDTVVITSFSSAMLSSTILGYRIFNDIFGRTHFKRLSKQNTTYLTRPLQFTDKEIYVADSSVLTPPIPTKKVPGVVIIDGERIEFFKVDGNTLGQLRRSTLGTAPSFYSDINTKVIDQSPDQTVPFRENILKQTHVTSNDKVVYALSTQSYIINTGTYNQFVNDGITLQKNPVDGEMELQGIDQISVFYGGRPLRKAGVFYHDTQIAYDSPDIELSNVGFVDQISSLPATYIKGTAYVVTATNQVWVYTASKNLDAFNGYVYRGLNYVPPEFSVNIETQEITLNIHSGIQDNINLVIVKKEFARNTVWNNEITNQETVSLVDSTTVPAKFLQARPAELPDRYYYGGDPALTTDSGFALTDNDNEPLEGF